MAKYGIKFCAILVSILFSLLSASSQVLPGTVKLGDPCTAPDDCVDRPLSQCADVCTCIDDYVANTARAKCLPVVKKLGEPCTEDQQCRAGIPGSLSRCTNGACRCNTDSVGTPDVCRPRATLVGGECEHNAQCANLGSSFCLEKKCACTQGAVSAPDNKKCLTEKKLGEPCQFQVECDAIKGSAVCETTCKCGPGYYPAPSPTNPTECRKLAELIGAPCEDDNQCSGLPGSYCNPMLPRKCLCPALTHVDRGDKKGCLPFVVNLNGTCEETSQCEKVKNTECKLPSATAPNWQCLCVKDFIQTIRRPFRCLEMVKLGDPCHDNAQCRHIGYDSTVQCVGGTCGCPATNPPSEFHNDQCVIPRRLGELCENHDQCQLGVSENAICIADGGNLRCNCLPGAISAHSSCWGVKRVGDKCTQNLECSVPISGSVACDRTGICTCSAGAQPIRGGAICDSGDGNYGGVGVMVHASLLISVFLVAVTIMFK